MLHTWKTRMNQLFYALSMVAVTTIGVLSMILFAIATA